MLTSHHFDIRNRFVGKTQAPERFAHHKDIDAYTQIHTSIDTYTETNLLQQKRVDRRVDEAPLGIVLQEQDSKVTGMLSR
jgi:hypothetical protein